MRVALLTNFVAPYRLPLLEALSDRVTELRVFLSTPMEKERRWKVDWGGLDVTVQRTLSVGGRYRDPLGFTRRLEIHLPYDTLPQLGRFAPDVVISAELGMRSLQAALYCAARRKTAFVVWATLSEHSERGWGKGRRALRRFILSRADGVLVNGESGARYIRRFGVPGSRITIVNQPVDGKLFANDREVRVDATWRLLHSGALVSRKGLVGFMSTLADRAARNPGIRMEIAWLGDGEERDALASMSLPPNLMQRFLGEQPYHDLPKAYGEADILVFPSLMDEWGLVVNEAMAAGLPVLGSVYSQAVEELVTDGVTGWTFDPADTASVHAALERMFSASRATLRSMGENARERIATLTPESASERIAQALRQIVPKANHVLRR